MSVFVETQLELAGEVLNLVRAELGPSAEAEVLVDRSELALTRYANSFIHQNVADAATRVSLRLHHNGRTSTGTTTLVDADGLRALVARVGASGALLPPDPLWPGVAPPAPTAGAGHVDEATVTAAPDERAARVRSFVDAAGGLDTAGYCRTAYVSAAFVNTAGQSTFGAYTEASLHGIARAPQPSGADGRFADGMATNGSTRLADIDGARLGALAAAKARAAVDPVDLPPGDYEVVLEPSAVADLLTNFSLYGFNGKAYAERRSFVELGAGQFDPALTLVDDATAPGAVGLPFDTEGTPKRRVELVRNGVSTAIAHDRRTARLVEAESTGHAHPGSDTFGPATPHLSIEPGPSGAAPGAGSSAAGGGVGADGPIADASVAALVTGVRRGLLVTDFWYTRVLDPRTLVVTGLTRNGVWLVEDGEVTRPVRDLRFTQSYPRALGPGRVLGVGSTAAMLPSSWGFAALRAPALRLASWQFTGGASG